MIDHHKSEHCGPTKPVPAFVGNTLEWLNRDDPAISGRHRDLHRLTTLAGRVDQRARTAIHRADIPEAARGDNPAPFAATDASVLVFDDARTPAIIISFTRNPPFFRRPDADPAIAKIKLNTLRGYACARKQQGGACCHDEVACGHVDVLHAANGT